MNRIGRSLPRPAAKRLFAALLYLLFLLVLVEVAARLYWKLGRGTPFFDTPRILRTFYPELAFVEGQPIRRGDQLVDVLLLGGSVLNNHYGSVGLILEERLTRRLRRRVLVHNLARRSHTSLDSLFKYAELEEQQFDLVVVYHGINETRANNCPPERFREDYSHFAWYDSIHRFRAHPEVGWLAFPFTFEYAWVQVRDAWGIGEYISRGPPKKEWLDYGGELQGVDSFARNMSALVQTAGERGDPVLLMSFAYYIAPGYSEEAFRRLALDYSKHGFPIEFWGRPLHVAAALEAHNTIVERLGQRAPHAAFVDQNGLVPKTGEHFNDVCHLTGQGSAAFVDNLLETVVRIVR